MNGETSLFSIHLIASLLIHVDPFCRYQCFSANCLPDHDQWVSFFVSTWMNTDYCMITSQQMHFRCIKQAKSSLKVICIRFYLQTTFEYWLVCFQLQTQTQQQQAATTSMKTLRAWTTLMKVSSHLIWCTTFIPLTWLEILQNGDANLFQSTRRTTLMTTRLMTVSDSSCLCNTITFWFTLDDAESVKMEVSSNSDSNSNINNDSDSNSDINSDINSNNNNDSDSDSNHDNSGETW